MPRRESAGRRWVLPVVGGLVALVVFAPLVVMLVEALRATGGGWTIDNLRFVVRSAQVPLWLLNSLVVAVSATAISLAVHSMAGFALSRLQFRGRDVLFFGAAATMFVSLPVILVPLFIIVRTLGLLNSYPGIVLPIVFGGFGTLLMRQFFLQVPRELEEAARLDGCGHWRTFLRIFLPISRPALASLGAITFLASWNMFLWPLTITSDPALWVSQVGIASFQTQYSGSWGYVMAVALLSSLPTLVVFFVLQRYLVASLKTTGLK